MRLPDLDALSFWIGFIVASVIWAIIMALRPALQQSLQAMREQREAAKLQADTGIEDTYRKMLYKQTQGMHISASLFALDEIAEPTRLLAPPIWVEPGAQPPLDSIISQSLPYLLTWPETAAAYNAPSLSLPEALSGGMNLALVGQPGCGRTVALASLAAQIAKRDPATESLHHFLPLLLHVADLNLPLPDPKKPQDLLEPIIEHISENAPVFSLNKIPGMVIGAFTSGRALLLLDGVDELPRQGIQDVAAYLRLLLQAYPKTRIVTTGGTEYLDGLLALGLYPLAVLPWNETTQSRFRQKWLQLWRQYVAVESWAQETETVDDILLHRWLEADNTGLSALEYTLKLWAATAGDAQGGRGRDVLEAHIRRLTPQNVPLDALQILGVQSTVNAQSYFDMRTARDWTKNFDLPEAQADAESTETASGEPAPAPAETADSPAVDSVKTAGKSAKGKTSAKPSLVGNLVNSGLLVSHPNNRLRFAHPAFAGLLAGRGLGGYNTADPILKQPAWSGRTTSLQYFAAYGDATSAVRSLLAEEDALLQRPTLTAGRLLREAPANAAWRGMVMQALLGLLQNEDLPASLRMQAASAFVLSNDASVAALFRQLLGAPSSELRRFAALACGMLKDAKAVEGLGMNVFQSGGTTARAACLALVQIGNQQALETVATALLKGDEDLRRAAAEALANHPQEGHGALREGTDSSDILVRRAVVFGLANIHEEWATALLEKVQVEDEQWAVRNVAVEALAARNNANPRIPKRLTSPSETPWLIEFAGKYGMGVQRGEAATDTLLLAVKNTENIDVALAALNYLRYTPTEGVLAALYPILYGTDLEMREAVYQVLQEYALGGLNLPAPQQFGLGD